MKTHDKNWKQALNNLPEFEPSASVWEHLSQDLQDGGKESNANSKNSILQDLPEWEPSDAVWEAIEDELKPSTSIPLWRWSAAAIIGLFIAGSLLWFHSRPINQAQLSYAEERAIESTNDISMPELGPELTASLSNPALLAERPELVNLHLQLKELDASLVELEEFAFAVDDPQIQLQKARIVRYKAQVIKKMVQLIIA